jgi:site-specific recombinase XerD
MLVHARDISARNLHEFFSTLHQEQICLPFSDSPAGKPLSPHSIHQCYRVLKTFFRWLRSDGAIETDPMERVRAPKLPKVIVPRLEPDQVRALLEAIQSTQRPVRNFAIVALMVNSGLRVGEVIALKLGDVDLEAGRALVWGKGSKQREVPLSPITIAAIRAYLIWRPFVNYRTLEGFHSSPALFLSRDGSPLTGKAVYEVLAKIRGKLGWKRLYPHLLRHTFAKLYLRRGDLKTLQVILGHADISTTATFYLDPTWEEVKAKHAEASPLENIIGK